MTEKTKDWAILGPSTKNGNLAIIANDSEKRIEIGEFRVVPKGKSLNMMGGDVIRLTGRKNDNKLDVEYLYKSTKTDSQGPPLISSEAYRDGWESIWGKPIGSA